MGYDFCFIQEINEFFAPEAKSEFLSAVRYFEDCQHALGRRFRLSFESAVQRLFGNFRPLLFKPGFSHHQAPMMATAMPDCTNILLILSFLLSYIDKAFMFCYYSKSIKMLLIFFINPTL